MSTNKPEYVNCSTHIVGGLIEAACMMLMDDLDNARRASEADLNDAALLVDALHVLRPDTAELDLLDGVQCIVKGRYDDAIVILRQLAERVPAFCYSKALLAFSLSAKGDPEWQQYANEVMNNENAVDAQPLVRMLIARHEVIMAQRVSSLGGEFKMPESMASFMKDFGPSAAPADPEPAPIAHSQPQPGHLRA